MANGIRKGPLSPSLRFVRLVNFHGPAGRPDLGRCFVWKGSIKRGGYGSFGIQGGGKSITAHRAAWVLFVGLIPPSTPFVLHRCDNPSCVRLSHLFLGTHADNMADMKAKGRNHQSRKTHCPQGHPYDDANTRVWRDGAKRVMRICKTCACDRDRARRRADKGPGLAD